MRKDSLNFLQELLDTPSPSGFENKGQRVWLDYVEQFADKTWTDTYGNAVAVINPDADTKVMIEGHADEIGMMVSHITEKGFIYFKPIGGIDPNVVPGKRVTIHTANGPVRGVTGATAIHLQDRDNDKKSKLHEMYIDIGAKNKKEADKQIEIGAPITFTDSWEMMNDNIMIARALDNRIGTWIAAETLRLIRESGDETEVGIYACSCVQEEVGLRGAHMIATRLKPDMALISDVGHATDSPGIDAQKHGRHKLGGGPILTISASTLPEMNAELRKVAKKQKIKLQLDASPNFSGSDTDAIFKAAGGVACALVSLPIRYMHTTVEMCDLRDLAKIPKIYSAFCLNLKSGQRFQAAI